MRGTVLRPRVQARVLHRRPAASRRAPRDHRRRPGLMVLFVPGACRDAAERQAFVARVRAALAEAGRAGVDEAVRGLLDRILAFGPVPAGFGLAARDGAAVELVPASVPGPHLSVEWVEPARAGERHID